MPEKKSSTTKASTAAKPAATKASTVAKPAATKTSTAAKSSTTKASTAAKPTTKASTAAKPATKEAPIETPVVREEGAETKKEGPSTSTAVREKLTEKKGTQLKEKNNSKNNDNSKKVKLISFLTLGGFILLFAIVIICVLCVKSCSSNNEDYTNEYRTSTKVGYEAEVIGTVDRKLPEDVKDEGMSTVGYPTYGYTLSACLGSSDEKVAMRNLIIRESELLTTVNTWNGAQGKSFKTYNRMDSEGNLFLDEEPYLDANGNQRQLYKHTASEEIGRAHV